MVTRPQYVRSQNSHKNIQTQAYPKRQQIWFEIAVLGHKAAISSHLALQLLRSAFVMVQNASQWPSDTAELLSTCTCKNTFRKASKV